MLDLFAAIQSADPPSLVLWSLFVFAACMYPIGIMLGSNCSPCCGGGGGCNLCETGTLPETLTVTLDGFADQTPGPDLISLSFSSCFGSGAAGRVTAPGGDPATDKGPISGVSVTAPGFGYARFGRVSPTLTIGGGSGSGATFTPTLSQSANACGIDRWSLASVAVTGGTGYVDGEQLTITIASGDTVEEQADAVVRTSRGEPTLTLAGNATATFGYINNGDGTWTINSVTITNGGTGYADGELVGVVLGTGDYEVSGSILYGYTGRVEPTVSVEPYGLAGTGASLAATLTQTTDVGGRAIWVVDSVSIATAGTGYSVGDLIFATATDGQPSSWLYIGEVTSVDGSGGITGVTASGGEFFKSTGILNEVEVSSAGGAYYKDTGIPISVDVTAGGIYYREDSMAPPYVADVTVSISQSPPSDGSGAVISAVIDADTSSETFGQITGLTIDEGGDGYLAWQWVSNDCCGWQLNGKDIVLQRSGCEYYHDICGGWRTTPDGSSNGVMRISVHYFGPLTLPEVRIRIGGPQSSETTAEPACRITIQSDNLIDNCDEFSFSGSTQFGDSTVSASVSAGGEYDILHRRKSRCDRCCQGYDYPPEEIVADLQWTVQPPLTPPAGVPSGAYVLAKDPIDLLWSISITPSFGIAASVSQCPEQCDQCIKSCQFSVGIGGFGYEDSRLCSLGECGVCDQPTPVCEPAGSYSFDTPGSRQLTGGYGVAFSGYGPGLGSSFLVISQAIPFIEYWRQNVANQDECASENTFWTWLWTFIPYTGGCGSWTSFINGDCGRISYNEQFGINTNAIAVNNYKFALENATAPPGWPGSEQSWQDQRSSVLNVVNLQWKNVATVSLSVE